jgi:hypothetical protein
VAWLTDQVAAWSATLFPSLSSMKAATPQSPISLRASKTRPPAAWDSAHNRFEGITRVQEGQTAVRAGHVALPLNQGTADTFLGWEHHVEPILSPCDLTQLRTEDRAVKGCRSVEVGDR